MPKKTPINPADYITPLRMNGMRGRMLRLPAPKSRPKEILVVYGLHASLERMFGFAEEFNKYGAITIPDLPGFGGMDSFYKIGEQPTLDNLADYLSSFIQLRYKRKKVTIMGMSYGFVVVTRMLQKYPKLVNKVDLVVSLAGFVHKNDFHISKVDLYKLKFISWLAYHRVPAFLIKTLAFRGPLIRLAYKLVSKSHRKLKDAEKEELKRRIDFEAHLWQINDARTKGKVVYDMFQVNLCNQQVRLPVYHVAVAEDMFFDTHAVEQHMRIIFSNFERIAVKVSGGHAPTVLATAEEVAPFVPKRLRQLLLQKK